MIKYIYGKNAVIQRLKQRHQIHKIFLVNDVKEIIDLAKKQRIEFERIDIKKANHLVNGKHQGVIASIEDYKVHQLDDLLNSLNMQENPILVMGDHIQDPHNLGAILRTCDATGVKGVIINKHQSVGLNETVAKVSTGAIETIPVVIETNLSQTLKKLKDKGFWIVVADNDESIDYRCIPHDRPLVVVVGSEGFGVSQIVKKEADYKVAIFMLGEVNSLNVSVATGVLLYDIVSKRVPIER